MANGWHEPAAEEVPVHQIALAVARNYLGMQLPLTELLESLGLSPYTMSALLSNDEFGKLVCKYRRELEEDNEGIRLKSAIALEACIPQLYRLVHDHETPPTVVVQGFKALAETAGVTKQDAKTPAGPGFTINIDLSGMRELTTAAERAIEVSATNEE